METLGVLVHARELIATPDKWTQGSLSETASGELCDEKAAAAACFCLDGALMRASGVKMVWDAYTALGFDSMTELWDWNDAPERTHAEVLARLDEAIEKLRK